MSLSSNGMKLSDPNESREFPAVESTRGGEDGMKDAGVEEVVDAGVDTVVEVFVAVVVDVAVAADVGIVAADLHLRRMM